MRILARFMTSATDAAHFPAPSLPEIAFLGRSNVGKSSVINSLVGSKLARTSNTPGRTRSINFFEIRRAGHPKPELLFTDLPGYGYAKDFARNFSGLGPLRRSLPSAAAQSRSLPGARRFQHPASAKRPPTAGIPGGHQTEPRRRRHQVRSALRERIAPVPATPSARNTPRLPSCRFPPKPAPAKTTSGPRSCSRSPTSLPAKVFAPLSPIARSSDLFGGTFSWIRHFEAEQPSPSPDARKTEDGAEYLRRLKTQEAEDAAGHARCHRQHRGPGSTPILLVSRNGGAAQGSSVQEARNFGRGQRRPHVGHPHRHQSPRMLRRDEQHFPGRAPA